MALSADELRALDVLVDRRVRAALAGVDTALSVAAVNADGSVNLLVGDSVIPSVPAMRSYSPRAAGDVVLTRVRDGEHIVIGRTGPAAPAGTSLEISNAAPPSGQGWAEIVTGQLWARPGALWCKRVTADPGPGGGSLSRTGSLVTYRGGSVSQLGVAEQGDWGGYGLQVGLAHFGGSWVSALSGKTITGGTIALHRQDAGGIYGPVPISIYRALAGATIPAGPPSLIAESLSISLSRNQSGTLAVPAAWLSAFASGTADSLLLWTSSSAEGANAQVDSLSLTITTA